jgi:hypothetical protein
MWAEWFASQSVGKPHKSGVRKHFVAQHGTVMGE